MSKRFVFYSKIHIYKHWIAAKKMNVTGNFAQSQCAMIRRPTVRKFKFGELTANSTELHHIIGRNATLSIETNQKKKKLVENIASYSSDVCTLGAAVDSTIYMHNRRQREKSNQQQSSAHTFRPFQKDFFLFILLSY